ncbi:GumC family protein, partial [Methylopila musalis]
MTQQPAAAPETTASAQSSAQTWPQAFDALLAHLRRAFWLVVALAVVGAVIGLAVKATLPTKHVASAQLLIDPRSLQVFPNEMVNSNLDANAAINFVESQMQLITSERVLARAIRTENLADDPTFRKSLRDAAAADGGASGTDLRGSLGADGQADPALVNALRRALTVKRAERSYLVDVSATASTSDLAARIANGVVRAFIDEDGESRAESGRKLTRELTGRLEALRARLADSEAKAERFRRDHGLVKAGDRLVVEQRLEEAVTEATAAQGRLAKAAARVRQFEEAQRNLGSLGALTATEDMRTVSYLIERLSAARENLAESSLNLGPRHPALTNARSRVTEIEQGIRLELNRIRDAARVDLGRAENEQQELSRRVSDLTAEVGRARQNQIELNALEQEATANRGLLTSFESRSREADEFGRISAVNLRIASTAVPANAGSGLVASAAWAVLGATLGVMLALGAVALWAMASFGRAPRREPIYKSTGPIGRRRPAADLASKPDLAAKADVPPRPEVEPVP